MASGEQVRSSRTRGGLGRPERLAAARALPVAGGATSLAMLEPGRMWVDPEFRARLERAGLASLDQVMHTTEGRCLRALADRENWRLELPGERGPLAVYLKKHHVRSWLHWLRAWLGWGPGATAGRTEAMNVARLERDGIAAMRLIAYGEQLHADGRLESFVMTEELTGFTQLDNFLRQRFAARSASGEAPRDRQLAELLRNVAVVAQRFHAHGYNHRDLYCCHFFIREREHGPFDVNLIDLQRVEQRRRFRRRWIVKDLAQLCYSAPRDRVSCTHKLAFMRQYLGVRKLRPGDKRLIRQVLARVAQMERHLGAHP